MSIFSYMSLGWVCSHVAAGGLTIVFSLSALALILVLIGFTRVTGVSEVKSSPLRHCVMCRVSAAIVGVCQHCPERVG